MTIAIPADRAAEIAALIGTLLELMAEHAPTGLAASVHRRATGPAKSERLTIEQFCTELDIAPSTFYDWRAKGKGPKCIKLPNGRIVIRRAEVERWLESLEVD